MAINVTLRDIVSFPGGTPKTVTLDIAQVVPVGNNPEGDQVWVASSTTTATASGSAAIQSIFKTQMKRGFVRNSGLTANIIDVPANYAVKIAIDETSVGSGIDITLTSGSNILMENVAQDIENKLRQAGKTGGSKAGDLSYLNAQVRFIGGRLSIESGTVSDTFTGTNKSSVAIGAPTGLGLTDARTLLGLDIPTTSEDLASRQITESSLASSYTSGNLLTLDSVAGFSAGDSIEVIDGSHQQRVLVSGTGSTDSSLSATQLRFVTVSGSNTGLANTYSSGTLIRKFHPVDVADPVSAVTTVDQLYRFMIDSMANQIDFSA